VNREPNVLEQIKKKRAQECFERALRAMKSTLSSQDGRAALWFLLGETGYFSDSLWDGSSRIHYNVAVRDFGHKMLALMTRADESAVFELQRQMWHQAVVERLEDEKILKESE
jgi:hypothetical protein